ncbi:MAG: type II secretion system F family protein [Patescibacteria group bacterium]|nr:type II secretion system F family protein [Patescibacteria group bacterium]MDE2438484.1 type II secretion system F family protein [Patescibacteria group bacterium]
MNNKLSKKQSSPIILFHSVSLADRILFAKHLAIMTKSGMPIVESVSIIQRQVRGPYFAKILLTVKADLENGQPLSSSLEKFKSAFGDLFINIIRIGESSGTLVENLEHLALELKKNEQLHSKIKSALVYPVIILLATLGISGLLVFLVLPKIIPVLTSLGVTLPLTTRLLIAFTAGLHTHLILIIIISLFVILLVTFLFRIRAIKNAYQYGVLLLPIAGPISLDYEMALFARTLAFLLQSGIKIIEALSITAQIMPTIPHKEALITLTERVKQGEPMYTFLEQHPRIFASTLSRMIEVGERTGNLSPNLFYLADFYESELDELVNNLTSILEPVMLLVMGGIVAFVALSIITPIYQVTQAIH